MPDKLTDSEIIKALECWLKKICESYQTSIDLGYESISIDTEEYMCLLRGTIDLINRLQAENESLIKLNKLESEIVADKGKEIERLLQELQYPQADTVQPMSEENIVHCKECKHLMFSDFEGECSKGYKGIVRPDDSCPFGVRERGGKQMTKNEQKYINSLKEENERVKNLLLRFVDALGKLKNLDDVVNMSLIPLMTEENKKIRAETKAEAYKEFAEKLEKRFALCYGMKIDFIHASKMLDNLLKEMIGE